MKNEIRYFTRRYLLKAVIAARPQTGSAVVFYQDEQKWDAAPQNYFQIAYDDYFERISKEDAQKIFQDIPPDDLLNEMDELLMRLREKIKTDK
jgi:regulator of sirC expression with transglutaminase-like and TPR domain